MVTKHLSINDAGVNLWLEAVGNEGGQSAIERCSTKHTGVFVAAVKTKAQCTLVKAVKKILHPAHDLQGVSLSMLTTVIITMAAA